MNESTPLMNSENLHINLVELQIKIKQHRFKKFFFLLKRNFCDKKKLKRKKYEKIKIGQFKTSKENTVDINLFDFGFLIFEYSVFLFV